MANYIFVSGGVSSSIGKGMTAAVIGALLQARGFRINIKKMDPYLNINPGDMNPIQHGEVFVTDDGYESDLDLGHYERFTGITTTYNNNITTGQIYGKIIEDQHNNKYRGKTIQVIPHITNLIKEYITTNNDNYDFIICELGGTIGDIEILPFCETIRQLRFELKNKTCMIHVTYIPYIKAASELKTKPTQHSIKTLQSLGIQPDMILCRAELELSDNELMKISSLCNIIKDNVIPIIDTDNIYELPLKYHNVHIDEQILKVFGIQSKEPDLVKWEKIKNNMKTAQDTINVAIIGKYVSVKDSYKSVNEALKHAGIELNKIVNIHYIEAQTFNDNSLKNMDVAIVPGGFGTNGTEEMIKAIKYIREYNIPFLGICFGMQLAIIEYMQNVLGISNANSVEIDEHCKPVVILNGGPMRLGAYDVNLKPQSQIYNIYKENIISERHRHRYIINKQFFNDLEKGGITISGLSTDNNILESFELQDHKHYIGVQFHPELKSQPFKAAPLFVSLLKSI